MKDYRVVRDLFAEMIIRLGAAGLIDDGVPVLAAGSKWVTVRLTNEQYLALLRTHLYIEEDK